jgi:hypothetical protein
MWATNWCAAQAVWQTMHRCTQHWQTLVTDSMSLVQMPLDAVPQPTLRLACLNLLVIRPVSALWYNSGTETCKIETDGRHL